MESDKKEKKPGNSIESEQFPRKSIKSFNPAPGIPYEENTDAELTRKGERSTVDMYENEIIPSIINHYEKTIIPELMSNFTKARKDIDFDQNIEEARTKLKLMRHSDLYRDYVRSRFGWLFRKAVDGFPWFDKVRKIAERNSLDPDKVWIIGGFVCDNITRLMYEETAIPDNFDVDLLIEKRPESGTFYYPRGWRIAPTEYGVSLRYENLKVDLNYLRGFHSIQTLQHKPKLGDFFSETPLNIQSIAYDLSRGIVRGRRGIEGIQKKVVSVNNIREAERLARIISEKSGKKHTIEDVVTTRANRLKFKPIMEF